MSTTHNVFISHVHKDDAQLQGLKDLVTRNGYSIRDSSIDSESPNNANSPDYIKYQILAPRIRWAGTMVVLIGPTTHQSDWVHWEIEYAHKNGMRIVGVYVQGGKESDLPEAFEKYGDALVGWNSENLMGAIGGEHNNWCEPNATGGYDARPRQAITRYGCK